MIWQPPSSTLFPYTTLFRSMPIRLALAGRLGEGDLDRVILLLDTAAALPWSVPVKGTRTRIVEDRKSTRLNSSHRTISYAVFCLKKKSKEQYMVPADRLAKG